MVIAIIVTILVVILLQLLFLKIASPMVKKVIDEAINVSCYVNTYHYTESEYDRVQIGQETYYKVLFGDKHSSYKKSLTDYVFWVFYTQIFNDALDCIPIDVNKHNNRCLADGEDRRTGRYLDKYQENLEEFYSIYSTDKEKQKRRDRYNIENEKEDNM